MQNTQTVAEIAAGSLAAVRVFEKLGIDYCCGGKRPLAEICEQKGYDTAEVRRKLDEAINAQATPERDWNTAPLRELIGHIVNTHHEYLRRELPVLSGRLDKVYRVYSEQHPEGLTGLPDVFSALRDELESHLMKEEAILFPAVSAYEAAHERREALPRVPFGSVANPIRMMEFEHDNAGDALRQIRAITKDFAVPEYACVTYKALLAGLKELEADLHVHIHLENNILFPRVIGLERRS